MAHPLFRLYARLTRGMTLGVRGIVTNEEGRVGLVRHTYVKGWHLPGGGVERGETAETALARELQEEAGVKVEVAPALISVHSNEARFPGDHVLLYRIAAWTPCAASAQGEIAEMGWFTPDALPDAVTAGTRTRLQEVFQGRPPDPFW